MLFSCKHVLGVWLVNYSSWEIYFLLRSYFSIYYRLLYIPLALVAVALGLLVDIPTITVIAACKFPYMLLKGWRRLFHDCIGREGPFLETICVPFAGLAILLWPMAVVGAFIGSMLASILLGAYSGIVVYQVKFPFLFQGPQNCLLRFIHFLNC